MIKLPSLTGLWQRTVQATARFPVQFILILIALVLWYNANEGNDKYDYNLYTLMVLCNLAFCITLASDLMVEVRALTPGKKWLFRALAVIFSAILFFLLSPKWLDEDLYRLGLFIFAGHLLLSFLPFSKNRDDLALWQFNKFMLFRFITAVFYSGVLYLGLLLALESVKNLFELQVDESVYYYLFGTIGIGFNSLFFLIGIPSDLRTFTQNKEYPKNLKVFTQYVLIPLVTVYLAILLSYEFKIALEQALPQGMVSILIMGYSVIGILAYLLIYPIKNEKEHAWVNKFSYLFFFFMIPLVFLLFIAVGARISEYGFTESRYFLLALAVWLSGITVYFLLKKSPPLKVFPISLFIFALLATFGPQNPASIAQKSQLARYKNLGDDLASKKQKATIIDYMTRTHGISSLQSLTSTDLKAVQKEIVLQDTSQILYQTKGKLLDSAFAILAIQPSYVESTDEFLSFERQSKPISILGYDQLMEINSYSSQTDPLVHPEVLQLSVHKDTLIISNTNQESTTIDLNPFYLALRKSIEKDESAHFNAATKTFQLPDSLLSVQAESSQLQFKLLFKSIRLAGKETNSFNGLLFIKKKTPAALH